VGVIRRSRPFAKTDPKRTSDSFYLAALLEWDVAFGKLPNAGWQPALPVP